MIVRVCKLKASTRTIELTFFLRVTDRPPASHPASVCETLTDDNHRIRNLLGPLL
ncbi:hypothetical protein BN2476_990006 [Paraburkholderia piptadeniae]|uniref:Uncharacterized protein n=1 Tax=Paraburkholderia piptadeniae TaxID=1701573 RepID=A0A1N7SU92_9BURK|nr:hypothetical protein [Paraburkholderia piptadeniae]SIT51028.1 hypothetical protein BN2476_990006 [Paraburkholderia piptadeniae]